MHTVSTILRSLRKGVIYYEKEHDWDIITFNTSSRRLGNTSFAEGQATSKGDITFTEPTNTVEPLNPTDPSKPVEPADPENPATGQTGPLTLDVVPELPFGTHEIESGTKRIK